MTLSSNFAGAVLIFLVQVPVPVLVPALLPTLVSALVLDFYFTVLVPVTVHDHVLVPTPLTGLLLVLVLVLGMDQNSCPSSCPVSKPSFRLVPCFSCSPISCNGPRPRSNVLLRALAPALVLVLKHHLF